VSGAALHGWQLGTVVIAGILVAGFLLVMLILREGRSRTVRVGVFVEREELGEKPPEESPADEAPTEIRRDDAW
jgi:hypothetical protein